MGNLAVELAVITGAASGNGRRMALRIAEGGAASVIAALCWPSF